MTLTEARDSVTYEATMETGKATTEESLFLNIANTRDGTGNGNFEPGGSYAARLNPNEDIIGPAKMLVVSAMDTVDLTVYAKYPSTFSSTTDGSSSTIGAALAGIFGATGSGATALEQNTYDLLNNNSGSFLASISNTGTSTVPKAYLNYVFFDQDFKYQSSHSGYLAVTSAAEDAHEVLNVNDMVMPSGGYLYVYVSNEGATATGGDVYFDALRINHKKGTIIQEDHYYPFGMNISALSSTAPLAKPNKYKYNGNEEQLDFNWNIYDFNARLYDAQLGRFGAVDPKADVGGQEDLAPYQFGWNNPILYQDPSGLCPDCPDNGGDGDTFVTEGGAVYMHDGSDWVRLDGVYGDEVVVEGDREDDNNEASIVSPLPSHSGYLAVTSTAEDAHEVLNVNDMVMPSGGYLYVYVSNEGATATGGDVYFDALRINHKKGTIIQEDHYYPFGMNISALSSTAPLAKPNKYKYNGNEEQLDFNWNIYDFNARLYDAQIGRFGAVDPLADAAHQMSWNPYHFSYNNPANLADPSGLDALAEASYFDWSWMSDGGGESYNAAADARRGAERQYNWEQSQRSQQTTQSDPKPAKNPFSLAIDVTVGNYLEHLKTFIPPKPSFWKRVSNGIYNGMDWFNRNLNPLGIVVHGGYGAATGKDFVTGKSRNRLNSGVDALTAIPIFKVGSITKSIFSGFTRTGRVFWSGGNVAKGAAADFARANGMKTLEMTNGGRIMGAISPYLPRSVSGPAWDFLSARFARGASGTVNVFQNAAGVSLRSTWNRVEYPILLGNASLKFHIVK